MKEIWRLYYQQSLFLEDEITSQRQYVKIGNNEKDQNTILFGEENVHNSNLDPFKFSQ